ncbi:hypothetical protein FA95DRAFT_1606658 [Auriscalpium vulgare]|uniref:Uncharacterized protein n=1 Tax=Auriscalpium vulgare TaxID=40419 RepID=A0ACB8RST6_9AGAM|nr:hypothetical protein FA95DRAFT_1606658 [Auriscalpium vulgare]
MSSSSKVSRSSDSEEAMAAQLNLTSCDGEAVAKGHPDHGDPDVVPVLNLDFLMGGTTFRAYCNTKSARSFMVAFDCDCGVCPVPLSTSTLWPAPVHAFGYHPHKVPPVSAAKRAASRKARSEYGRNAYIYHCGGRPLPRVKLTPSNEVINPLREPVGKRTNWFHAVAEPALLVPPPQTKSGEVIPSCSYKVVPRPAPKGPTRRVRFAEVARVKEFESRPPVKDEVQRPRWRY